MNRASTFIHFFRKNSFNFFFSLIAIVGFQLSTSAQSAGFNTSYAVFSINSGAGKFYQMPSNNTDGTNPYLDGAALGSFVYGSTTNLILQGAQMNVYKCGGADITATFLNYRIYKSGSSAPAFTTLNIGYSSGNTNGCGGADQQWQSLTQNVNVLSGLSVGNYIIEFYANMSTSLGTQYLSNNSNNYKATFIVTQRPLNFTGSKTYDGSTSFSAAQLTAGNIVNSDAVTLGGTATVSSKNVGTYTSFATNSLTSSNGNYTTTGGTVSVSIGTGTLTYNATSSSKVYGNANPAFTGTVTGFATGETQSNATTGTLAFGSTATTSSAVGTYAITGSGLTATNGNYTFVQASGNATALTVTQRPLNFTGSKTYNGSTSFSAAQLTAGNIVNSDAVTLGGTATVSSKNVGTYTSFSTNSLTSSNANYTTTGGTVSVSITTLSLNFTGTKTYDGTATFNASQLTAANVVSGDVVTLGGTATVSSSATGTYTSFTTNALTSSNSNYVVTGGSTNVSIIAISQSAANYRSNADGLLSSAGTWQYDAGGGNWTAATTIPTSTNNVSILNKVNFDQDFTVGNGKTLSVDFTASADTLIIGAGKTLTIASGATTDFKSQNVTFQSNINGTASLAQISGTLNNASNVTVERYIPDNTSGGRTGKAWRLLTTPVATSQYISNAWQEGATWNGTTPVSSAANPFPGYGTLITGYKQGTAASANNNGYDFWSAITNGLSSIQKYSIAAGASFGSWVNLETSGTKTKSLNSEQGYLLFVRGDRSINGAGTPVSTATILRATGTLNQGQLHATVPATTAAAFTLIGNPYPATIKFDDFYNTTNNINLIQPNYYVWDANLGTLGGYLLIQDANGTYTVTPAGSGSDGNVTAANAGYIQSGEAFFVMPATSNTSGGALNFFESNKVLSNAGNAPVLNNFPINGSGDNAPKTIPVSSLSINLSLLNTDSSALLADGVLAKFSSNNSSVISKQKVAKAYNIAENLSIYRDTNYLIVDGYKLPTQSDTVHLKIWGTSVRNYQFNIIPSKIGSLNLQPYLVDKYLGTTTMINQVKNTVINFAVNTDALSQSIDRFCIVFMKKKLNQIPPVTNLYSSSKLTNSTVMKAFPNPATIGKNITLTVDNLSAGTYHLNLYNAMGTILSDQEANHDGGIFTKEITIGSKLSSGLYYVKLVSANGSIVKTIALTLNK